jgi:hypothetical protein
MPELYGAKVDYKEARILADLTLILQDLTFTVNVLERLRGLLKDNSKDRILIESLWTSALISYVRCFSSGKRFGLTENIFKNKKLKGDPIGCHRYYKNLRDKHIAHSVNPFEQVAVDLELSRSDSGKREVLGVGILSQKLICVDVKGVETLLRLTLIAREEVHKQAQEYEVKTLEVGKNLPIDTLYAKARSRIITPGPEDAGKVRKN